MSKLRDALRKKFKTPREAILALGLDESLLTERAYDSVNPQLKEKTMQKIKLSGLGTVAYGALMTFLRPQLAMDQTIDLKRGLRNINARNFKAKRPVLAAWISESVKDKLDPQFAHDGALNTDGLDAVLDMVELALDDFPEEMKEKMDEKKDKAKDMKPMAGAKDEESDEDSDMDAEDEDETEEEKEARMKKRAADKKAKDKKMGKDKKAKDKADVNEDPEEHDPETPEETANDEDDDMEAAMDAKINAGIQAGIKKERDRMEAISVAKDHVRSRVGNLSMAFDSAAQVYAKAIEVAAGKKPPKDANVEMLKFAFDNLPSKDGGRNKQTYAMDSAPSTAASDLAKRNPALAKNLERIGRQ
jgi:hypothetical protein